MKSFSSRILRAIGPDAMQKLVNEFGGQQIYVPLAVPEPGRDDNILRLFSESLKVGSTMNAYQRCADQSGLSVRRIQKIVARS